MLEAALDETNYDPYIQPAEKKVVHVVIEKATNTQPEDKITWQNQEAVASRAGRPPAIQLRRARPGTVPFEKDAKTPLSCFSLFITDEMLEVVVMRTNERMDALIESNPELLANDNLRQKDQYHMTHINIIELKAFIGLQYLRGLMQLNYQDYDRLFEDKIGHPIFSATMSKNRFKWINRMITFDDPQSRPERARSDRFAAMRSFFEVWNDNCGTVVNCGDCDNR
jgi:hypothetical protein